MSGAAPNLRCNKSIYAQERVDLKTVAECFRMCRREFER